MRYTTCKHIDGSFTVEDQGGYKNPFGLTVCFCDAERHATLICRLLNQRDIMSGTQDTATHTAAYDDGGL